MEESDCNKKLARRRSDFVLGRRKSRGRSSCITASEVPIACENLPYDQRLKQIVLESVKLAAHRLSEELKKEGEEQSLDVLVAVEESCEDIRMKLEKSGVLQDNPLDIKQTENSIHDDLDFYEDYCIRLTDESKAWDSELQQEKKSLFSIERKIQDRSDQTTLIPYTLDGLTNSSALLSSVTRNKNIISHSVLSLSHCVDVHKRIQDRVHSHVQDQEQKIRQEFEDSFEGEDSDIFKELITCQQEKQPV